MESGLLFRDEREIKLFVPLHSADVKDAGSRYIQIHLTLTTDDAARQEILETEVDPQMKAEALELNPKQTQ